MYLLDANVFISAKKGFLSLSLAPAFWTWIEQAHASGQLSSVDAVLGELSVFNDDLSRWANALPGGFFRRNDLFTAAELAKVTFWANNHQHYHPLAAHEFLRVADSALVAHGAATRGTVVTFDTPSKKQDRIKVPDACRELGVKWIHPHQMLKAERVTFPVQHGATLLTR